MYNGINNKDVDSEKNRIKDKEYLNDISKIQDYSNKFIGRLATIIIMEDGLYIGWKDKNEWNLWNLYA